MTTIYIVTENTAEYESSGSLMLKAFYDKNEADEYAQKFTDKLPYLHRLVDEVNKSIQNWEDSNPEPYLSDYSPHEDAYECWDHHFLEWHENRDKFIEMMINHNLGIIPPDTDYVKSVVKGWAHADATTYTVTGLRLE